MNIIKHLLSNIINLLTIIVLIRVLFSWITVDRRQPWVKWVYLITEPLLSPFKKLQERMGIGGPLDLSPLFLVLMLSFISSFIMRF